MLLYTGLSEDRMPQHPLDFIFQGIVGISFPISTAVIPSAGCLFSSALARMWSWKVMQPRRLGACCINMAMGEWLVMIGVTLLIQESKKM